MARSSRTAQSGVALIEALVAALLLVLGVLGLVGALGQTVSNEADVEYRSQATRLAAQMMSTIWLNVDRSSDAAAAASLQSFSHLASTDAPCRFSGTASSNALVSDWIAKMTDGQDNDVTARLPGATDSMQQIVVLPANNNQVTIILCWQASKDVVARQYVLRAFIN
jgi:type IV pilus assembly protein PilV